MQFVDTQPPPRKSLVCTNTIQAFHSSAADDAGGNLPRIVSRGLEPGPPGSMSSALWMLGTNDVLINTRVI